MEKASLSGFVNGIGRKGAVAVTPAERQRKRALKAFGGFLTALHEDSIKAPYSTMYSVSHKFSTLTATPVVVRAIRTDHAPGNEATNDRVITLKTDQNGFKK